MIFWRLILVRDLAPADVGVLEAGGQGVIFDEFWPGSPAFTFIMSKNEVGRTPPFSFLNITCLVEI